METVIVGVIVAVSAAVLVAQLRRKLGSSACDCNAAGEGGKCAGCSGHREPGLTPKCHPEGVPSARGDAR